jgi:hypothetical protein
MQRTANDINRDTLWGPATPADKSAADPNPCANGTSAADCGGATGRYCGFACAWNESKCVAVWDR